MKKETKFKTTRKEKVVLLIILAASFAIANYLKSDERGPEYTPDGDLIQENGLTQEQELEIRFHCAEKPHAWDCQ